MGYIVFNVMQLFITWYSLVLTPIYGLNRSKHSQEAGKVIHSVTLTYYVLESSSSLIYQFQMLNKLYSKLFILIMYIL